jgi:hypothetical protein
VIILGALALVFNQVTYTEEEHEAQIGPIEIGVEERETVRIPMWAGIVAVVVGAGLVLIPAKRTA